MMTGKTHIEKPRPQISVSRLADYMAASEQVKRDIIRSCKYQPIARLVQHDEAKAIVASYLCSVTADIGILQQQLEKMEARFFDNQFDADVNGHNCDYVRRFIAIRNLVKLPNVSLRVRDRMKPLHWNGTRVSFYPDLLVSRVTRRNTVKTGAVMLRYAKSKALEPSVGIHQSALIFGYIKELPVADASEPEKPLCITLDAYEGAIYEAPGNSVYLCKEMAAACASIAERWPAIQAPPGSVL
jgi:hypothetical protein